MGLVVGEEELLAAVQGGAGMEMFRVYRAA